MRKSYDSKFKSRVALEAMRGELTIAEIASKYQVHANQVQNWKKRLQEGASELFMWPSERKAEQKKMSETLASLQAELEAAKAARDNLQAEQEKTRTVQIQLEADLEKTRTIQTQLV